MLRLERLLTYTKNIRKHQKTGKKEVDALDTKGKNQLEQIWIPEYGYVLKPNEIYVAEVDNPSSPSFIEKNFLKELTALGVDCKVVGDECIIKVERPVRIYENSPLFYDR